MQLPGSRWKLLFNYDAMHCLARAVKVVILEMLQGTRWDSKEARKTEDTVHEAAPRFDTSVARGPGQLKPKRIQAMRDSLVRITAKLPSSTGLRRLADLFTTGQANKHHSLLAFAGPVGGYVLWQQRRHITSPLAAVEEEEVEVHEQPVDHTYATMARLLATINIMWAKEHHR